MTKNYGTKIFEMLAEGNLMTDVIAKSDLTKDLRCQKS